MQGSPTDKPLPAYEEDPRVTIDVRSALKALAKERPLFHSGHDFKFALAWKIKELYPDAIVRLERPVEVYDQSLHVDILAVLRGHAVAIEAKYRKCGLTARVRDELFVLWNQAAHDALRYEYIKDIARLESITAVHPNVVGYAILLTNDRSYWTAPARANSAGARYRLNERVSLPESFEQETPPRAGTTPEHATPIVLKNQYTMYWKDYCAIPEKAILRGKQARFRYLLSEVS